MEKRVIRIIKKGEDESNLSYWLSMTNSERMIELQKMRIQVNQRLYGTRKGFQSVYRVVKKDGKVTGFS